MNNDTLSAPTRAIAELVPEPALRAGEAAAPRRSLLAKIASLRLSAGDLNEAEFTQFLHKENLPAEAGFEFLSFGEGYVTLSVPTQATQAWYPGTEWISPVKEELAEHLAAKYGLRLYEPVNNVPACLFPLKPGIAIHHHLELHSPQGPEIVAHPQYLKIRLKAFGGVNGGMRNQVLTDLASLYRRLPAEV